MTDVVHDPPANQPVTGLNTDAGNIDIPADSLERLSGPGFEKYALMRAQLGEEPLRVIARMRGGGYRYKAVRGRPDRLVLHRRQPVPDLMSFRQIAPLLSAMTGVAVTYETVRRWWEIAFPEAADEPEEPDTTPVPVSRAVRRRTPTVGDEHAETIRAAMEQAKSTNPAVPPAAFVAPDGPL